MNTAPASPINPNVFKRYRYILQSPEGSPSKKITYGKSMTLETEDY